MSIEELQWRTQRLEEIYVQSVQLRVNQVQGRFVVCKMVAEDIVQNAFVTAIRNLHKLHDVDKLEHWLTKIIHTEALQALRKGRRRGTLLSDLAPEDQCAIDLIEYLYEKAGLKGVVDPRDAILSEESQSLIRAAIAELPNDEKHPYQKLVAHLIEGLKPQEIANELETHIETVYRWIFKLRRILRHGLRRRLEHSVLP